MTLAAAAGRAAPPRRRRPRRRVGLVEVAFLVFVTLAVTLLLAGPASAQSSAMDPRMGQTTVLGTISTQAYVKAQPGDAATTQATANQTAQGAQPAAPPPATPVMQAAPGQGSAPAPATADVQATAAVQATAVVSGAALAHADHLQVRVQVEEGHGAQASVAALHVLREGTPVPIAATHEDESTVTVDPSTLPDDGSGYVTLLVTGTATTQRNGQAELGFSVVAFDEAWNILHLDGRPATLYGYSVVATTGLPVPPAGAGGWLVAASLAVLVPAGTVWFAVRSQRACRAAHAQRIPPPRPPIQVLPPPQRTRSLGHAHGYGRTRRRPTGGTGLAKDARSPLTAARLARPARLAKQGRIVVQAGSGHPSGQRAFAPVARPERADEVRQR